MQKSIGKKIQKRKIKGDRKRLNCYVSPGMAWDEWIPAEYKDKRGSESVTRETKEILKDCHGNRCFGNRVLKAYRESALENGRTREEGVTVRVENEAEGAGEEEDGPKETTLTFGCHIRPRDSNRSHGSNFLGWTWELGGKRQLRSVLPTTLSRVP